MKIRESLVVIPFACMLVFAGCSKQKTANTGANRAAPRTQRARAGENTGTASSQRLWALITLQDPPAKLRTGQQEPLKLHVKNTSDVVWWQRGGETNDRKDNKFYLAAAGRWLDKDGSTPMKQRGHNGIPRDLKPGDEADMTIHITAPKEPGEYLLELIWCRKASPGLATRVHPPRRQR